MTPIYVKPAPGLDPAAAKVLKSDTGVGLLDVAGNVPEAGTPWPNGGLTLILLRDGVILRADDPVFAALAAQAAAAKAEADAAAKASEAEPAPAAAAAAAAAPAEPGANPVAETPPAH